MNTDKTRKSIREEVGIEYAENFIERLIAYMEINDTFWTESKETGVTFGLASIKICRSVLHWANENSKEFIFYEGFK